MLLVFLNCNTQTYAHSNKTSALKRQIEVYIFRSNAFGFYTKATAQCKAESWRNGYRAGLQIVVQRCYGEQL